jgi:hypothetical protein
MTEEKKPKSDQELREELLYLINTITSDSNKQPANRIEAGFGESKFQFTSRGRNEKEHLRWYDLRRHSDMKAELLLIFNDLNPDKKLGFIEDASKATERPTAITYPHISWIELTCHAAVKAVRELNETGQQEVAGNCTTREDSNGEFDNSSLRLEGPPLTLEQIAKQLQREKPGNTIATIKDSLKRQCRRRIKEANQGGLVGAQPLYKNGDIMRDIYIIDWEREYLFKRRVRC